MSAKSIETSFSRWRGLLAVGIIVAAGLLAYHNSFGGPFIFDDRDSIPENPTIRQLWNIRAVLSPPAQGQAVQRRPIVNLSLAINYAISGLHVRGYHVFNTGAHVLAALTLFGVLRRTLRSSIATQDVERTSFNLSLVIALIWVVHPIHTDAVTYIIQRTEVLAGLFYLLTLYFVIRASSSSGAISWYIAAVIACLLGMGSKESMISAPLLVLLYDRVFLSSSFKEVFRRRWALYLGLAATWGLVVVYIPHGSEGAAVFGRGSASIHYASTQFEAISNYLRLCFWPTPLILDYGIYKPTSFWRALPYAIFITSLLAGTVVALRRRPWLGFLGVWFFAILAPSSSFVPVFAQASAEKRMYLPLAAVVVAVVLCGYALGAGLLGRLAISDRRRASLGRALGYILAGAVVVILGLLTFTRNSDYASEFSIWDVAVRQCPDNSRAYNNRGLAYKGKGELDLAICDYNKAIELDSSFAEPYNNRGVEYAHKGDYEQAIRDFDQAIKLNPMVAQSYYNKGKAYFGKGDYEQAIHYFGKAIEFDHSFAKAYNNRAIVYGCKGNYDQAIRDFDRAIELNPGFAEAYYNRDLAYRRKGALEQAIRDLGKAIELNPDSARAHNSLAWILATCPEPHIRDGAEAVRLAERACELTDYKAPANLDTLAAAYAELGQFDQAVKTAEKALRLAQKAQKTESAEGIRARMELYKAKRPYREPFTSQDRTKPGPKE